MNLNFLKTFRTIRKKTFLLGGFIILALIILPITLFFFQQKQSINSNAEKSVVVSYEPNSSQIPVGSSFSLNVFVDPGTNLVSYIKLEMLYDPKKFTPAGSFSPNDDAFSHIEGPVEKPGQITEILSIGTDLSKAIKAKTLVGTLSLKALPTASAPSTSKITFGSTTQALSISGNSSYSENVIANTVPATVHIGKPENTCGSTPSDVILLMDTSDSMRQPAGGKDSKLQAAVAAARNFVDEAASQSGGNVRIGLVTFDVSSALRSGFTNSYDTLKNILDAGKLPTGNQTCMQCGIDTANNEINLHKRPGVKTVVILITDGEANTIADQDKKGYVQTSIAQEAAMDDAVSEHKNNGTVFHTIGLGKGKQLSQTFLDNLAEATDGRYYYSPTTDQLNAIYKQISQKLEGGSVTGMVFDFSKVGATNKVGLQDVALNLYAPKETAPEQTITTDSKGIYAMEHICDGSYTLKQQVPPGWKQVLPPDHRNYQLTIKNGTAVTDEDFGDVEINASPSPTCIPLPSCKPGFCTLPQGNYCHPKPTCTPRPLLNCPKGAMCLPPSEPPGGWCPITTPSTGPSPSVSPSGTPFSVNIFLHGIGNSGDNANPTESSLSNKSPLHPTRNALGQLFDVNNNLVATATGTVLYSSDSGSFKATLYTKSIVTPGRYTFKVGSDYHLTRLVPGILNIVAHQTTLVPDTTLVAGDVNGDNRLDILDYNLILDCYSDLAPALNCDDSKKIMTDLNDDGSVNQFDYNLFLREISTQPGE